MKKVEETGVKCGKYKTWTLDEEVEIGKYFITHTVGKAVHDLSHKYPGLSKQSVNDCKKVALAPTKKLNKRGRPSLLPEEIMNKTIQLVKALRLKGAPISIPVITSIAKGIIEANDQTILVENGGYLTLEVQRATSVPLIGTR